MSSQPEYQLKCLDEARRWDGPRRFSLQVYVPKWLCSIVQPKNEGSALSLRQKIFRRWDKANLTSQYTWPKQLDLFFKDSGHAECAHRNQIMRLVMEDPIPLQGSAGQQSMESDLSIHMIQSTVIREGWEMYRRYHHKNPEDLDRAALVFAYWEENHSRYNYENILERCLAKRSLINLFYRLNVTDTWLGKVVKDSDELSRSTFEEEYTTRVSGGICEFATNSRRQSILADHASDRSADFTNVEANLTSPAFSPSYHETDSIVDHYCSVEDSSDGRCHYERNRSSSAKVGKKIVF